jgi:hypothetical protein
MRQLEPALIPHCEATHGKTCLQLLLIKKGFIVISFAAIC